MPTVVASKQPKNTRYDSMIFPDYEYSEFPMAIPVVKGKIMPTPYDENHKPHPVVIVQDQAELDALRGPEAVLVPIDGNSRSTALRVEGEDDIRKALYLQAEQCGAKIDKRWAVEKIEDAIKAHVEGRGEIV